MKYYTKYNGHKANLKGVRKIYDNNIYTFDIESTSYFILDNEIYSGIEYEKLTEKEKKRCKCCSNMYIWMFGINEEVYYGRTWKELKEFLEKLEIYVSDIKYVFVHNLAFEFQFLKGEFDFIDVIARKSHKVMRCEMKDYNIIFKCSLFLSNAKLSELPRLFKLPVDKKVGDLDYSKLRHSKTELTEKELSYCEYDCLVLYYYIKYELETYETIKNIPLTSTGKVRRELTELVRPNKRYKMKVNRAINVDTHVFNLLQDAFMGGYTHANWIYTDEVLENVDSYDETSAYPYVMTTHKFPSSEFRKCNIKKTSDMLKNVCYLFVVKFTNLKCKYHNTFISGHKAREIRGARYDNGRIIEAKSLEMTLTDVDFLLILDTYNCEYEIIESYFSSYNYLPIELIEFILDKYLKKTKYKGISELILEYTKEKNMYNAIYGMTVTNNIKDEVLYHNDSKLWEEKKLDNKEIEEKLKEEKKRSFLSFSYGCWVTAYARNNLIRNIIRLDDYSVYSDTDSIKLIPGYDKTIFTEYNKSVIKKIRYVSKKLGISEQRYMPKDINGIERPLGIFECETENNRKYTYDYFITQGAKKYATQVDSKISITVAGVPKEASKCLNNIKEFKDNLVFKFKDTNKMLLFYSENQDKIIMTDYNGVEYEVDDLSGCCLLPTSYELKKAEEYAELISDNSSARAKYKE